MGDTDPKMMRTQQNKDVRETIPADETAPRLPRHDSDAASTADRTAAKAGTARYAEDQMDAILAQNRRTGAAPDAAPSTLVKATAAPGGRGLASRGRSLLGD